MNILLSSDLTDSTRILFNQQVQKRAELALPFLMFDEDPYLVVTDSGRSCGCSTLTPRRIAIRTRRARATASTTCATA